MKLCNLCKFWKPLWKFYIRGEGLSDVCCDCDPGGDND